LATKKSSRNRALANVFRDATKKAERVVYSKTGVIPKLTHCLLVVRPRNTIGILIASHVVREKVLEKARLRRFPNHVPDPFSKRATS